MGDEGSATIPCHQQRSAGGDVWHRNDSVHGLVLPGVGLIELGLRKERCSI